MVEALGQGRVQQISAVNVQKVEEEYLEWPSLGGTRDVDAAHRARRNDLKRLRSSVGTQRQHLTIKHKLIMGK
jgi:hypothetical protein